jgi:Ca-activated chloride channel homolog
MEEVMKSICTLVTIAVLIGLCGSVSAQPMLVPVDRGIQALGMEYYRVEMEVTDGVANADVKMGFRNHTARQLEATFIFPLPDGASIGEFRMEMNGKWVEGKVLEKQEAARIYTSIVARMKDPGLLELVGKNLFQARVFPVPANGVQKIELSFATSLPQEGGNYALTYPLKTAQYFCNTAKDFTFSVKLHSSTPLKSIYSPTHKLSINKKGDNDAVIGYEQQGATFSEDLKLFYSVDYNDVGLSVLSFGKKGDPGFFMLLAAPGAKDTADEIPNKKLLFIVDTSGSMVGEKMKRVKSALSYAINKLKDGDRFNIIRFSTDVEKMFDSDRKASSDTKKEALAFVADMEASGGTAINEALTVGTAGIADPETLVVFLTDGEPTIGETDIKKIAANVQLANRLGARLFPFGVGVDLNTVLLDQLARDHRGSPTYMAPDLDIEASLGTFYDKISHPVLSNIKLSMPGASVFAVLPGTIPDLFRGEQLVIVGRYRKAGATLIRLEGTLGGKKKNYDFEAKLPENNLEKDFIPRLWAKRQVGVLLEQIRIEGERKPLVDEVTQLATRYGIVTPYTSYLVTEPGDRTGRDPRPPRPVTRRNDGPRDKRGGLNFSPRTTSGFGGAPAAAPMAEAEESIADMDDFKKESGEKAVEVARKVKRMKNAKVAGQETGNVRVAAGKTFCWQDGGWVDEKVARSDGKHIRIKLYSEAYFALVTASQDIARYLSLGEKVTFVFKGYIIEIAEDGTQTLPADLKKIL